VPAEPLKRPVLYRDVAAGARRAAGLIARLV
jgi:hypothetical protein